MKKILAGCLAMTMIFAFTSCSKDNDSESKSETTTTSAAETTTTAEEETSTTTTEAIDEVSIAEDDSSESKNDTEVSGDVYVGDGYTLNIDETKWTDRSSSTNDIAEYTEDMDTGLDVSADQMSSLVDCIFMYNADGMSNFNIVTQASAFTEDMDYSLLDSSFESQYASMTGCTYKGSETVEINGYKSLKVTIEMSADVYGLEQTVTQYLFFGNGLQVVISFTTQTDSYDTVYPDFEDILNTFSFAE